MFTNIIKLQKGSLIVRWLPFFIVLTSCADLSEYGRVEKRRSMSRESFTFSVTQEYLDKHKHSKIDKKHPKMTKSESYLLKKLLKKRGYCLNEDGKIVFKVNSRQEKIFDMTFAYLIEKSYNARPVTPRMYYGECINENPGIIKEKLIQQIQDEVGKLK